MDFDFRFQLFIKRWYQLYGRTHLPWRLTTDSYAILVSELMLQQTQVSRVLPKYQRFLEQFPTLEILRQSSLAEVLTFWQGLGYNRRARYLWQLSQSASQLPKTEKALQQLPGIGAYTAAAVCAFAYNQPVVLIETNVRSVFLYHFFPNQTAVGDEKLLPLIAQSLDQENPRQWYWALMDYGAHLKTVLPNPNRLSKHYVRQTPFSGSLRQVRGQILRLLLDKQQATFEQLQKPLQVEPKKLDQALAGLLKDGLVRREGDYYGIT